MSYADGQGVMVTPKQVIAPVLPVSPMTYDQLSSMMEVVTMPCKGKMKDKGKGKGKGKGKK